MAFNLIALLENGCWSRARVRGEILINGKLFSPDVRKQFLVSQLWEIEAKGVSSNTVVELPEMLFEKFIKTKFCNLFDGKSFWDIKTNLWHLWFHPTNIESNIMMLCHIRNDFYEIVHVIMLFRSDIKW